MTESILALRGWSLQRDSFRCGPLDIELNAGEVTTLLGPSGIGKTLTMLSALGYVEEGLIATGGRSGRGVALGSGEIPPRALYIPQQSPFNPNWRVRAFLARLPWGRPTLLDMLWPLNPARARRVDEVLASLGLEARRNATAAELSGGEIQRAALAQVFLLEPELLVGDEFISALDPGIALWILEQCREALLRTSGTALFALHDVPSALRISDQLLLLFPPWLAMAPWRLIRDSASWHVGIVHTSLCASRWCTDQSMPDAALERLVRLLHDWIFEKDAIERFLATWSEANTLCILPDGSLVEDPAMPLLPTPRGSESWTDIAPVDSGRDRSRVVGVAIPRRGATALQILVRVRN